MKPSNEQRYTWWAPSPSPVYVWLVLGLPWNVFSDSFKGILVRQYFEQKKRRVM